MFLSIKFYGTILRIGAAVSIFALFPTINLNYLPSHPKHHQRHERPAEPKECPLKAVHLRNDYVVRSRYAVRSNYSVAAQELTIGGAPLDILNIDCVAVRFLSNCVRVMIEYAITLHLTQGVGVVDDFLLRNDSPTR